MKRLALAFFALGLAGTASAQGDEMAMRWWNTLNGEQMVAALHGDGATPAQITAAQMMYADLDSATMALVDAAAMEIYGDGGFTSVGEWWETLDCRKMRIAAGDGNMADPSSPYCAHYPGSGAAKILGYDEKMWVDTVGLALLGRRVLGAYPLSTAAMYWWNTLNGEQMVAALHGDDATPAQTMAAQMMYADLDSATMALVDAAVMEIYGDGDFTSVGEWWETLDCRKMRIAAGDGNMADPSSPYCAHYPGSGAAKILGYSAKMWVDTVGMALLGRDDPGMYPPLSTLTMYWWDTLNGEQMVAALHGDGATPAQITAAQMMYADLDSATMALVDAAAMEIYGDGGFTSVGEWWETLDCRKMRIAAGDGNMADPSSPYCAHYPGSGAAKILSDAAKMWVDTVGMALLGRDDPGMYPPERAMLPLFPAKSGSAGRSGMVRIINHAMAGAEVYVYAYDDAGMMYGPAILSVGADTASHFNSADLASGNPDKRLADGIGEDAMGDLRLSIRSASYHVEGLTYLRDGSGMLSSMHDMVPRSAAGHHRVAFFNPASNMSLMSRLRVINLGDAMASIRITGEDAGGACSESAVELELAAGAARTLSAQALESGEGEGLSGALGDGMGKWQLTVSADQPLAVMSLLHGHRSGGVANLSTTTAMPMTSDCM